MAFREVIGQDQIRLAVIDREGKDGHADCYEKGSQIKMSNLTVYGSDEAEAQIRQTQLEGWYIEDGWLRRKYTTDGWKTTMMLVNAIGFICEAADHHADLSVSWGKVWVKLKTHSLGGLTDKDFALATKIEEVALWRPSPVSPLQGTKSGFVKQSKEK